MTGRSNTDNRPVQRARGRQESRWRDRQRCRQMHYYSSNRAETDWFIKVRQVDKGADKSQTGKGTVSQPVSCLSVIIE